jgi:hypothetical protein
VAQHFGTSVPVHHDPNHYAKGLLKNVLNLCTTFPVLKMVAMKLKQHFLIGKLALSQLHEL